MWLSSPLLGNSVLLSHIFSVRLASLQDETLLAFRLRSVLSRQSYSILRATIFSRSYKRYRALEGVREIERGYRKNERTLQSALPRPTKDSNQIRRIVSILLSLLSSSRRSRPIS